MAEGNVTTFMALIEKFSLPQGNYKKPKLLYCCNGGYFLRILPDGKVEGIRERSDKYIRLHLNAESVGVVSIKGIEAGHYLAMDSAGCIYASEHKNKNGKE
ncbi:fibroblast growth factor 1 isoform X2 [Protopterus annectens]|uniref:fibroblast growth factor 1 isoform X2 n=1 Tax=Protopterus annectens TaxID=7888 RepID=UPI001CFAA650|nr:fibroblast growth factor 1 isoform X2 [Protopterus annectens]